MRLLELNPNAQYVSQLREEKKIAYLKFCFNVYMGVASEEA